MKRSAAAFPVASETLRVIDARFDQWGRSFQAGGALNLDLHVDSLAAKGAEACCFKRHRTGVCVDVDGHSSPALKL